MGPEKFQNITTILFDLDNTLINTRAANHVACEQVFHYLLIDGVRRSFARDVIDKFQSTPREEDTPTDGEAWRLLQWRKALGPALSTKSNRVSTIWKEAYTRALRPFSGHDDLLLGLRVRFKVGLLANKQEEAERWGSGLVDASVGGATGWAGLLEVAFHRLDVAALECVIVTGRGEMVKAGRKVGCGAVVWAWSEHEEAWPGVDLIIRDLRQLPDLLPEGRGFASRCQQKRLGIFHSLRDEGWMDLG